MIIYNNKGNPYGLQVEICVRAAGSNIPIQEVTSDGMKHLVFYLKLFSQLCLCVLKI